MTSLQVFVIATDSAGNTILNPSSYNAPVYLQLGFDMYSNPDVTLSATYATSDPSPCTAGTTASTSSFWGSIPICSPSDVVTATLIPNVSSASYDAYVFAWISSASLVPTPAPSSTPAPFPTNLPATNSYADIYVYPVATPTPPTGILPVTGS